MIRLKDALAYARGNGQRFETELGAFIRFASVSAQPRHADDIARCASRSGSTDGSHLRPLRCPARRADRGMALAAVRARGAGRRRLWKGRERQ
jgi:hypothetical protein